jgi:hypothetical protein
MHALHALHVQNLLIVVLLAAGCGARAKLPRPWRRRWRFPTVNLRAGRRDGRLIGMRA